jgi:hypothetical protein
MVIRVKEHLSGCEGSMGLILDICAWFNIWFESN